MKNYTEMEIDESAANFLKTLNKRVFPVLCRLFYNKGLMPAEIGRITKDILIIIGDGGVYSADILNRKLQRLGWDKNIIDNFIFNMIIYYLEYEGTYQVKAVTSIDCE